MQDSFVAFTPFLLPFLLPLFFFLCVAPNQELWHRNDDGEMIFGMSYINAGGLGRLEPSCEPDEDAAPGGSEVRHERRRSLDDDDNPSVSF